MANRFTFAMTKSRGSPESVGEYERLAHLNVAEFQRFCDRVGAKAQDAGMTEEELQRLLLPGPSPAQKI